MIGKISPFVRCVEGLIAKVAERNWREMHSQELTNRVADFLRSLPNVNQYDVDKSTTEFDEGTFGLDAIIDGVQYLIILEPQ